MTSTLKLADDLFPGLLNGEKTCTIRSGRRDIQLGPLVFESVSGELNQVTVEVISVIYMRAGDIPDDLARADGARDGTELLDAMKRFYPDLKSESEITAVIFHQ
ncbi:MAG: ASCH domain-containing protein [Mesorhizobium sp.]|nr:MAG: ASCH domain-containing protein [Mesorhizobium sp.]